MRWSSKNQEKVGRKLEPIKALKVEGSGLYCSKRQLIQSPEALIKSRLAKSMPFVSGSGLFTAL